MNINENNYIQQLQSHNESALIYVIDQYGALVMSVIRKHLFRLPDMQEECLNDVLMGVWQHIDFFDPKKNSFKNWIAAIARYQSIDYLRKYQKDANCVSLEDAPLCEESRMEADIMEREFSRELQGMLNCLKPIDRELFLKLFVEEEEIEKVSRDTGMKKSAIYNRVSRAKKKLRKLYPAKGEVKYER